MKNLLVIVTSVLALSYAKLSAQCALLPIPIDVRIESSSLIVEAEIIDQQSYRSDNDHNIYTSNTLKVYSVLKGNLPDEELTLISPGGYLEDSYEEVTPSIYVRNGVKGFFFLIPSPEGFPDLGNFKAYSGPQGCIYLNSDGTANDVFNTYSSREEVRSLVSAKSGLKAVEINKIKEVDHSNKSGVPLITSITPDTTVAGTKEEIVIRGEDFGTIQGAGTVEFRNASTGPSWIQPFPSEYRLWTDTMIIIRVPSDAGTGAVKVTQGGAGILSGPYIKFAHLNFSVFSRIKEPFHKDNNGNGGFTWRMSATFNNNTGARDAFVRAMNTWRDNTCINWDNGNPTNVDRDAEDDINIVRFAASNELPNGVLGITRNRWKNCGPTTGYTNEIDLSYDPDVNWHTGTNNPSFNAHDMESVIVHELGHAHQLGHVINESDFMHATIGTGVVKRNLIDDNIESGLYVMKKSVITYDCGPAPMVGLPNCNIPVGLSEVEKSSVDFRVYPNPVSETLILEFENNVMREIQVYNIFGTQVDVIPLQGETGRLEWSGPTDLPAGLYLLISPKGNTISKVVVQH